MTLPASNPTFPNGTTGGPSADVLRVVHLVAHTHWDREWYHPAATFQARLVALIDARLAAGDAEPFLLDGQAITLVDYLAVRPEREAELAHALATGALESGPWYVLADNLIPSGEAIIRNLEAGKRTLRRLGASAPPVAYCPDTFGHPAALPMIAKEFGCDIAVVWRGLGGSSFPAVDTMWWAAPSGARVLLHHLPPDGYEFGSALPVAAEAATQRWRAMAEVFRRRNRLGEVLLLAGADHHAAQPDLTRALAQLREAAQADGVGVVRSGLRHAAAALLRAAQQHERLCAALPCIEGELRNSYGYTWTLQGTLATRAHLKRANARLERALLRDVEPWTVLAWLHAAHGNGIAADGSISLAQIPSLLRFTWEQLLQTHPHDTLCGCAVDAVAFDMATQHRRVAGLTVEVREASLQGALHHDRVAARSRAVRSDPMIVVRNRAGYARGGVAELRVVETLGDVPVGPASAGLAPPLVPAVQPMTGIGAISVQRVRVHLANERRESPQHYPDNDLVRVHRVLAWVPEVPAFGLRAFASAPDASPPHGLPTAVTLHETDDGVTIANGHVRIVATRDGVSIIVRDRRIDNALSLETREDQGDSYTPSLRGEAERLELTGVRANLRGPLRASVRLYWQWRRGSERVRVRTELMLDAAASHVRCDVRVINARRQHRLQLVWRTDVTRPEVVADAAFGPVRRVPLDVPPEGLRAETPPATQPLHRWLCAHDDVAGVCMLSDGLAEGEVAASRMAVTLVRSIGELSRADIPERPGHAGWPAPIPAAQCQGHFSARVGLLLHSAWSERVQQEIESAADALLLPLVGETWRDLDGAQRSVKGPTLEGDGLVVSAVHLRDDGDAIVLRALNVTTREITGHWVLPDVARWRVRFCRMDGTPLNDWTSTGPHVSFTAAPRAVVTIEIARADNTGVR